MTVVIKDLSFTYANTSQAALDNLNLSIADGEFVCITGPSGSGKTTLAHCLNGIIPHYLCGKLTGEVIVCGSKVIEQNPAMLFRQVGSVLQDVDAQMVAEMVEDEIVFGLENLGLPSTEIKQRIDEALAMAAITPLRSRLVRILSGGQRQRVAIAAALAARPQVLVLDEPLSALDPLGSEAIAQVLQVLNRQYGLTIVVCEQKTEYILPLVDRCCVLNEGSLIHDGPPKTIIAEWIKRGDTGVRLPAVALLANCLGDEPQRELPLTIDEGKQVLMRYLEGNS